MEKKKMIWQKIKDDVNKEMENMSFSEFTKKVKENEFVQKISQLIEKKKSKTEKRNQN